MIPGSMGDNYGGLALPKAGGVPMAMLFHGLDGTREGNRARGWRSQDTG